MEAQCGETRMFWNETNGVDDLIGTTIDVRFERIYRGEIEELELDRDDIIAADIGIRIEGIYRGEIDEIELDGDDLIAMAIDVRIGRKYRVKIKHSKTFFVFVVKRR